MPNLEPQLLHFGPSHVPAVQPTDVANAAANLKIIEFNYSFETFRQGLKAVLGTDFLKQPQHACMKDFYPLWSIFSLIVALVAKIME